MLLIHNYVTMIAYNDTTSITFIANHANIYINGQNNNVETRLVSAQLAVISTVWTVVIIMCC